jgi:hypothetical protein
MIYQNANNGIAMEQFNKNVTIRYNMIFQNGQSGIHLMASTAIIEHNLIIANNNGISLMDHSFANIRYNTIQENHLAGIFFETDRPSAIVQYNTIKNNSITVGGMEFHSLKLNFNNLANKEAEISPEENAYGKVNAVNNWWGTTDETAITDKIRTVPHVAINYFPYLTVPVSREPETGEEITSKIQFDYKDLRPYDLGYIPGDQEKDRFPWVLPDDETRRIVKRLPHGEEFPWSLTWAEGYLWMANDLGIFKSIRKQAKSLVLLVRLALGLGGWLLTVKIFG